MPEDLPTSSRYELLVKIAAGGMATVFVGRGRGKSSITRLFAIKRAHPHLVDDVFRRMFVAEARLASRIHHPNVVAVQDVEELGDELILVMDYVEGASVAELARRGADVDVRARVRATTRIVLDACAGLHAAHTLRGADGASLGIVHRDVSPHNVLVGLDGIARLTDFGIAKSAAHTGGMTATGGLKGKLGYMAPEYVETSRADQRADVFALGVVLWEGLVAARLFQGANEVEMIHRVMSCEVPPPSSMGEGIPRGLDEVVLRALARSPEERFPDARSFADALEAAAREHDALGGHPEVGALVESSVGDRLEARRETIRVGIEGAGGAEDPKVEQATSSFEYAGHDRTQTLDPTVQATPPPAPPPASPEPLPSPPNKRAVAMLAIAAASAIGGVWLGTRVRGDGPQPTPVSSMPLVSAAPANPSSPSVAPAPVSSTAPPTSRDTPPVGSPPARPPSLPRPVVPPPPATRPEPSETAEPIAPTHAPPNPYRDGGR